MCTEIEHDESISDRNIKSLVVKSPVDINASAEDFKQAQKEDLSLDKLFLMTKRNKKISQGRPVISWYEIKNETLFRFYHSNKIENVRTFLINPHKLREKVLPIGLFTFWTPM